MKNNKKMWIGIGCGILAVALIVGIILMAGGNSNKDPNPTNPSTSTTEPSGNVTEPSGAEPGNSDVPTTPTAPVLPPEDPDEVYQDGEPLLPDGYVEPTGPEPTMPDDTEIINPPVEDDEPVDPTEPSKDPTFSGGSYVPDTDDEDDELVVDPKPTNPTPTPEPEPEPEPEYDFGGYTAATITHEVYSSWSFEKQCAWGRTEAASLEGASVDTRYNFWCATEWEGGYDCGYEGHYCASKKSHDRLIELMEQGCPYCGEHDCVSFFARDEQLGVTMIDFKKCPKYHNNCEVCGLPQSVHDVESGEVYCNKYLKDTNCHDCGEPVKANECHHCIKP